MKAVLALIFFACVAGSMASNADQFIGQLVQEAQTMAHTVFGYLQQQILGLVQQAVGELSSLVASIGGARIDLSSILNLLGPLLNGIIGQGLNSVLGGLQGLIGGRLDLDIGGIFQNVLDQVLPAIQGIGQHLLNQGLAAVLGGLGSLGGRGFEDLWQGVLGQVTNAVSTAQNILQGVVGGITTLGSNILDASKPHWEQLQEQLIGHGLNVLGSVSETINNLHGSITGGR
ncbi:unnamed protein product [Rotaria sordida]|uniref:Uncharacterized protein n=1 Tax=Rotaria sordida TaxID=392033 RepID=A0A814GF09_9BILA|nr:unnamed protein product [Rotaria sordida]CAF1303433.1 unnamed protein product [Rotaria sordida]